MERDKLLEQLNEAVKDYLEAIAGLGERALETKWLDNRWGVREITAHLVGWLGQLGAGLTRMSRGEPPQQSDELPWSDADAWNEVFASHAKGKRKHEIEDELRHAIESFKNAALALPEERFSPGKTAAKMFDAAGISHFQEHAAMIREWRKG